MSSFQLDRVQLRRKFGRAARSYEQHDALQRIVQDILLERLEYYDDGSKERKGMVPKDILDIGAGTGHGTALLKKRYPSAEVIAVDIALPMLAALKRHSSWRRPLRRVCAEATALPFPDHSFDVVHSNLCFQWVDRIDALFAECCRLLRPGGMLVFSSFGPDTLKELRAAWAAVDENSHVSRFLDMHDVGDAMINAGLREPVLEVTNYTMTYSTPRKLLDELRGLGATHADAARPRQITGKARYQAMLAAYETMRVDGRIPASWEVVTAHAWGPPPGQSRRLPGGGEVASFSVSSLKGSRRS